jgi:hypothetical protein
MRLLAIFGVLVLGVPMSGFGRMYTVPSQPVIQLTRQDSREILSNIENQLSALEKGNFKEAYDRYTSIPLRQITTLEQFTEFVKTHPALEKNKSAIFGNVEIKDNVASIEGTLTSLDGKSMRFVYFFIKENSDWKIIGIEPETIKGS